MQNLNLNNNIGNTMSETYYEIKKTCLSGIDGYYVYRCEFGTHKDVRFIRKDQLKDFCKKEGVLMSDLRMEEIL